VNDTNEKIQSQPGFQCEISTRNDAGEGEETSDGNGNHAYITVAAGESHRKKAKCLNRAQAMTWTPKQKQLFSHARQLFKVSGLDGVVRVRAGASHTLVLCDGGRS
jgi:hypothetical protein